MININKDHMCNKNLHDKTIGAEKSIIKSVQNIGANNMQGFKEQIKIIVVNNNFEWVKTMVNLLNNEKDFYIVGTAYNIQEAICIVNSISVDLVIFSIDVFENNGNEFKTAFDNISKKGTRVLLIDALNMEEFKQVFLVETIDFLPGKKNTDISNIVRTLVNDNPLFYQSLLQDYFSLKKMEKLASLTLAEKEVFQLLEQKNSISQIGYKLNKSEGTIKCQINKILKKLDAKSSKEAVRKLNAFKVSVLQDRH